MSSRWWHGRRVKVPRVVIGGALLVVAVVALGVVLVPSMLGKDDTGLVDRGPAPTYTGTDFLPESQAQNVADAMSAFTTYVQVSDAVAQDHFRGWKDKLMPLTGTDVWAWYEEYGPRAEAEGYYQVGERVVESVRLKDGGYVEDRVRGIADVHLGACIDSSRLSVIAPGSQDDGVPPGRYSVSVRVAYWPEKDDWGNLVPGGKGRWLVDKYSVDGSDDQPDNHPDYPWDRDQASSCTERELR